MQIVGNVPIIESRVCGVEHMNIEMKEKIHLTLKGIAILFVEEVHTDMGDGNKGSTTMIPYSRLVALTTKDVTA